jgi:uncharacterized protein (DUF4415 family)
MRRKGSFVRYTADELSKLNTDTDWAKVDALTREEIERQAEADDGPLPDRWEETVVLGVPGPKRGLFLRLDPDVLDWFRAHGPAIRPALMPCSEPSSGHGRRRNTRSESPNNRAVSMSPKVLFNPWCRCARRGSRAIPARGSPAFRCGAPPVRSARRRSR